MSLWPSRPSPGCPGAVHTSAATHPTLHYDEMAEWTEVYNPTERGIPDWASQLLKKFSTCYTLTSVIMAYSAGVPYALSFANTVLQAYPW